MAIFEEIQLDWKGKTYSIPPDKVLRCIAQMEDIVTLGRLHEFMATGQIPLVKLSRAFASALRFAGARVSDDEVYSGMFEAGTQETQRRALEAISVLQTLMVPPEHLRQADAKLASTVDRADSSKPSTSSSSEAGGSAPTSSGAAIQPSSGGSWMPRSLKRCMALCRSMKWPRWLRRSAP